MENAKDMLSRQIAHRLHSGLHQNAHRLLSLLVPKQTEEKLLLSPLIHPYFLTSNGGSNPLLNTLQVRISSKAPTSPLP